MNGLVFHFLAHLLSCGGSGGTLPISLLAEGRTDYRPLEDDVMKLLLALMLLVAACHAQEDTIESEDKIVVIDTHPITFPPNQIEAATQLVINWADEDVCRNGHLWFLSWIPPLGNVSMNRSIA